MTMSAWVKLKSLPASGEVYFIAAKDIYSGSGNGYGLELYNNGTSQYIIWLTPGSTGTFYMYALPLNAYNHLAVTQTGTAVNLYVNGVLLTQDSSAAVVLAPGTTAGFTIGGDANSTLGYLNGDIDDVRIYNTVLTLSEVRALYQQANKKIQVSTTATPGDMSGGGGGSGVAGADWICRNDFGTSYKAMIVDNTGCGGLPCRRACTSPYCGTNAIQENIDWVLRPNVTYVQTNGISPIFTADWNGAYDFVSNFQNPIDSTAYQIWTGLGTTWGTLAATSTCTDWTLNSGGSGGSGDSSFTTTNSIGSGGPGCATSNRLYCVEQ